MVSANIVSRFSGTPPADGDSRIITNGPLYPAEEVLHLLEQKGGSGISFWTRKCSQDMQNRSWDHDDALDLIRQALKGGRFRGSEWCQQRPVGPWAACDAYSVTVREWAEYAQQKQSVEYYVKFAIGKTGQLLLLVSCHLS